jgi:hypothetical protein
MSTADESVSFGKKLFALMLMPAPTDEDFLAVKELLTPGREVKNASSRSTAIVRGNQETGELEPSEPNRIWVDRKIVSGKRQGLIERTSWLLFNIECTE